MMFEIPFDSQRKAMSVVMVGTDGKHWMYTKGAPEVVLGKCVSERLHGNVEQLTERRRQEILQVNARLASAALRVLGLAYREDPESSEDGYHEAGLTFVGLVGMIDPPRDEVKAAVRKCFDAGIRPVMITGDHPGTALAIAHELHIAQAQENAVTGAELDQMTDDQLAERVDQIPVYARVSAEHKLRVVEAWKKRNDVVAMTGDGVNDAPAVKAADIGIAMGIAGTDVTKEASDMVLTDDNFASIVSAVEEGRGIFDNIQKFIRYLLTCNAGEVLFMFFAAVVGWPAPLVAIQILWINLVTDGLPALALGMEPPEVGIMTRKPRPPREPVITRHRGMLIVVQGSLIAAAAAAGFAIVYQGRTENLEYARTMAFGIMAFSQLFFSFACRSETRTLLQLGVTTNPYLIGATLVSGLLQLSVVTLPFARQVFETVMHPAWQWGLLFGLSLLPALIIEFGKFLRASRKKVPGTVSPEE
jgi:Ca2+-transporting ATPase